MTRTKLTNTKGRETVAKMREGGMTTNYQMRRIIGGILAEEGKDRMYEKGEQEGGRRGQQGRTRPRSRTSQRGWTGT